MTTKRIKETPGSMFLGAPPHWTTGQIAANLFVSPRTFIIIGGSSSGKTNNMIGRRDSTSLESCGRQLTPWSFASAGHMMCPGPAPATMTTSLSEKARLSLSFSLSLSPSLCSVKCLSVGRRTLS